MKPLLLNTTIELFAVIVSVNAAETASNLREAITFRASFEHKSPSFFGILGAAPTSDSSDTRNP